MSLSGTTRGSVASRVRSIAGAFVAAVSIVASARIDHGLYYWLFVAVSYLMLRAIFWARFSWVYTALAAFFLLGNWFKVSIHHIFSYPYVEPVGSFSDTLGEWQSYYVLASTMGLAIIAARGLMALLPAHSEQASVYQYERGPVRAREWWALLVVAAAFYTLNNIAGFFVTGVEAKISLPFSLNAPLAFMAWIGFALISSVLVSRDVVCRGFLDSYALVVVVIVFSIASISMASRAPLVIQAIPLVAAALQLQSQLGMRRASVGPMLFLGAFVLVVLAVVSVYRIKVYLEGSLGDSDLVVAYAVESGLLVVDRWVGAEALMVAVSEPARSMSLFFDLVLEDPAKGVDGIFQGLAGSGYTRLAGLTFLSLPGYFGVLGLSGSLTFVFFGTLALIGAAIGSERFLSRMLMRQSVATAVSSAAVAGAVTQISFPRLLLPFLFELVVFCGVLRIVMVGALGLKVVEAAHERRAGKR